MYDEKSTKYCLKQNRNDGPKRNLGYDDSRPAFCHESKLWPPPPEDKPQPSEEEMAREYGQISFDDIAQEMAGPVQPDADTLRRQQILQETLLAQEQEKRKALELENARLRQQLTDASRTQPTTRTKPAVQPTPHREQSRIMRALKGGLVLGCWMLTGFIISYVAVMLLVVLLGVELAPSFVQAPVISALFSAGITFASTAISLRLAVRLHAWKEFKACAVFFIVLLALLLILSLMAGGSWLIVAAPLAVIAVFLTKAESTYESPADWR